MMGFVSSFWLETENQGVADSFRLEPKKPGGCSLFPVVAGELNVGISYESISFDI
jgi:hypothetical protein